MFLSNTQRIELLNELKFSNLPDEVHKEISIHGVNSNYIQLTDSSNQQVCIKVNDNKYIYSQQNKLLYSYDEAGTDVKEYYTNTMDLNDYTEEDLERYVTPYYDNMTKLKEECGDGWKQIILECIFEQEAQAN